MNRFLFTCFFALVLFSSASSQKIKSGWYRMHNTPFNHVVYWPVENAVVYVERDELIAYLKNKVLPFHSQLIPQMNQVTDSLQISPANRDTIPLSILAITPNFTPFLQGAVIDLLVMHKAHLQNRENGNLVRYLRARKFSDYQRQGGCYNIGHALYLPFHRRPFYRHNEVLEMNIRFF
jgi:hypothetical protein